MTNNSDWGCQECGESFLGSVARALLWAVVFGEVLVIYGVR